MIGHVAEASFTIAPWHGPFLSLSRAFRPLFPPNLNGTRTQRTRTMASRSSYCHRPRDGWIKAAVDGYEPTTALPYSLIVLEYMASRATLDNPGYAWADQINSTPAAFRDSRAASRSIALVSTESQLISGSTRKYGVWSYHHPAQALCCGHGSSLKIEGIGMSRFKIWKDCISDLYLIINRERANLGCC